ncbi:MAG: hypothetical protein MJA83_08340, partial [Gammaproteobacteria bacterium]|nr:hypothetical protein [Gammaproteobacteria bacterium]
EMNGLLYVLTEGDERMHTWSELRHQRAYPQWIQPAPYDPAAWNPTAVALPPRKADAVGGVEFFRQYLGATQTELERAATLEILSGNVPDFFRQLVQIRQTIESNNNRHEIVYWATPDYVAVGSSEDFVRVPFTPYTAQHLADMLGCVLPTRKMADDIYHQTDIQIEPQPLTEARESPATFLQHNNLIEQQRPQNSIGQLVSGIKKDVVVTNRLSEKANRVAIYGWHRQNGKPIQPLSIVHVDWYVDYSHGVRLIGKWATVDGKPMRVEDILKDPLLSPLLSDEGPIMTSKYTRSKN